MSDETFDPAILRILEEVAAQPDSQLLRIARKCDVRSLARVEEPLKATTTMLQAPERHLVAAYREEVARALLELAKSTLASLDEHSPRATTHLTVSTDVHVVSLSEAKSAAQRVIDNSAVYGIPYDALIHVRNTMGLASLRPSELALLSHRFVPSDRARILAAGSLILEERCREAIELLNAVFAGRRSNDSRRDLILSCAWEALGALRLTESNLDGAALACEIAGRFHETRPFPLFESVRIAIMRQNVKGACRWAARVAERIPRDHPSVDMFVRYVAHLRSRGAWRPSEAELRVVAKIKSDDSDACGRMLQAMRPRSEELSRGLFVLPLGFDSLPRPWQVVPLPPPVCLLPRWSS